MNQFVESMRRLYLSDRVGKDKIVELYESGKITKEESNYILNAH